MKLVLKYLSPYKKSVVFFLIIKIIGTIADLAIPYILSHIIDNVVLTKDWRQIVLWGVIMVLIAIIGFTFNVLANWNASKVTRYSTRKLRKDLFEKIEGMSESQKDEITLPSLVGRMTTDTYNVNQMTGMIQRIGVRAPILLLGGIVVALITDRILTLVMVSILPIILLTIILIGKKGLPLFKDLQEENDTLVQNVRENATGARVIKALSKEEEEKKVFEKVNESVSLINKRANTTMASLNPIITVLLNVGLVAVIIFGAIRCKDGLCTKGNIVSFTSYFSIISMAMLTLTRLFIVYSKSDASAKRIKEIFELENEIEVMPVDDTSNHFVEFKDVSFSYLGKHNNISNISFTLDENESLGIIGATGSGKTTILNLLMRFYDLKLDGNIYFNGKNVKSYRPEELRENFGVVFQNDLLFNDTIYENVSFGRNLTMEEVDEALVKAQAYDFVNKLPGKSLTVLDAKGANLSGGQRQRILIARALAGNPKLVMLDDSSSALDYKTDQLLRNVLYKEFKNLIIVAQRISSIKDCTKILVLDKGKIVGYGTHEQLLENCQIYKDISYSQMGVGE